MTSLDQWPGDEARVVVEGRALSATILPERGGKIISIRDARGVEWMSPPGAEVGRPARPGDDFLRAEMAGWDECAPTIVACTVGRIPLADHGELWTKPFVVDGTALHVDDDTLGYRFMRAIEPTDDGLTFRYSATAWDRDVPFLWAAHPQFAAPEGTRVLLPPSARHVVDVMDPVLPVLPWSPELASIDTVERGEYRKLYVDASENASSATLLRSDNSALRLTWSRECRYLGLWFDNAAFRSEPIIAIEPSTAYFDSLATAMDNRRYAMIPAHRTLEWSLTLTATGENDDY